MFCITFMGGSEIRLQDQDNIIVTMWGGADVLLPTVAEKMTRIKKNEKDPDACPIERRANVITFMGGTDWKKPTMAREIEEMLQLTSSGLISDDEMSHLWKRVIEEGDMDVFETITFMGGAGEHKPTRKEEIKAMERICMKGLISKEELEEFKRMMEGEFSSRTGFLQEKLHRLMTPSVQPAQLSRSPLRLPPSLIE